MKYCCVTIRITLDMKFYIKKLTMEHYYSVKDIFIEEFYSKDMPVKDLY